MRTELAAQLAPSIEDEGSIAGLADAIGGISARALADFLHGKVTCPTAPHVARIAAYMEISTDEAVTLLVPEDGHGRALPKARHGRAGGFARALTMTKERRSEIAAMAAAVRHSWVDPRQGMLFQEARSA